MYCSPPGSFCPRDFPGKNTGVGSISLLYFYSYINAQSHPLKMLLLLLSCFSRVQLCVTPLTAAHQAPLSMGFSRHEYWSGLPFPSLGDLPDPGIEPRSPALQADALPSEPGGRPLKITSLN